MATTVGRILQRGTRAAAARVLAILTSDASSANGSAPTITAGSGAASASEVDGSLRLRTDGVPEARISSAWKAVAVAGQAFDSGSAGIKADVIAESTAAAGVTADSVLLKDGSVTVGSGGSVVTDTIAEKTAAAGVTADSVLLKDGSVTTADAGSVVTNTIAEKTAASGVTIDSCLVKDGAVAKLASAAWFKSTEQTGTGSSQTVAHGLGVTPGLVLVVPTELTGGAYDVAEGAHDATNVVLTVTSGEKYIVFAMK